MIRDTENGECTVLEGYQLEEQDLGYPVFVEHNFKGALFTGASIHFAHILESSFEGADLTGATIDEAQENAAGTSLY